MVRIISGLMLAGLSMIKATVPVCIGDDVTDRFLYQEPDSEFPGYNAEYLFKNSQHTGWTYTLWYEWPCGRGCESCEII
jgi:hypothetical protein